VAAPESYAYDEEGNRTTSHLSASHTTDIANRLTEDDAACYAYDSNGNLTTKTAKAAGACTGAMTGYTYDAQDQLTRIDFPDLTFAAYRYDGLGRRIEKDVNGAITQYVYDGQDILVEFDGAGTLLARYSHGQRVDQPLAVERDLDSSGTFEAGEQFYYQADHQGSVRALTDSAGLAANSYDYDAYGNIEASSESIAQPFT
jgi:YD repeat-containing protein